MPPRGAAKMSPPSTISCDLVAALRAPQQPFLELEQHRVEPRPNSWLESPSSARSRSDASTYAAWQTPFTQRCSNPGMLEQHVMLEPEPHTLPASQQRPPPPPAGTTSLPPSDTWPGGQHTFDPLSGTTRLPGQQTRGEPGVTPLWPGRIIGAQAVPVGQHVHCSLLLPAGATLQHAASLLQQTRCFGSQQKLPGGQHFPPHVSRLLGQPHLPFTHGSPFGQQEPPHFLVPRGHVPLHVPVCGSQRFEGGQQNVKSKRG